jgi:asparaginyl-tRNA synthetase
VILMDKMKMALLRLTSSALGYCVDFFHRKGFVQLLPVVLSPITDPLGPDPGSSVIKTGEIEYLGQRLSLTQSMILHKQIAIKQGMERLFVVSPNVRLEHPKRASSGRHLFEFSQLDFEVAGEGMGGIFQLMEGLMCGVAAHVSKECPGELMLLGRRLPAFCAPFPRYYTHELAKRFGEDWEIPASLAHSTPFWAISHKREFYDKDDPEREGMFRNYDLIYPEGYGEALSGAEREWEYDKIIGKMEKHHLDQSRYQAYLSHAREGLLPSAGGGFGIERLGRFLSGASHVGDMQLFRRVPGEKVAV